MHAPTASGGATVMEKAPVGPLAPVPITASGAVQGGVLGMAPTTARQIWMVAQFAEAVPSTCVSPGCAAGVSTGAIAVAVAVKVATGVGDVVVGVAVLVAVPVAVAVSVAVGVQVTVSVGVSLGAGVRHVRQSSTEPPVIEQEEMSASPGQQ
jgi:hypothetical protein